jgi:RNA polymerase sigma-70 factor (ECF subfamily)
MLAWLVVMMRRLYISNFVEGKRNQARMIPIDDWDAVAPATQLLTIELAQVAARWTKLSPNHREILSLVAIHGASYEEAADRLRVPMGTIRSRLARARTVMRADDRLAA